MKILDKNTDFYDYLQFIYPDDRFTFDRTDSFILTKKMLCENLKYHSTIYHNKNFILMQICNTFWLFLITITDIDKYDNPIDYTIELLSIWKNYNKPKVLYTLSVISFDYKYRSQLSNNNFWKTDYDYNKLFSKSNVLMQAIDNNDYKIEKNLNYYILYKDYKGSFNKKIEKHIPLLKACGIAKCVNALDIYLSFEEYFSLEKTFSERTEAYGTTDNDKIETHGFDIKTSFRGKNK